MSIRAFSSFFMILQLSVSSLAFAMEKEEGWDSKDDGKTPAQLQSHILLQK